MRAHLTGFVLLAAAVAALGGSAQAQEVNTDAPFAPASGAAGWTFTPSLDLSSVWDDNPLLLGKGDDAQNDLVSVVAPHGSLNFTSPRTALVVNYDGAFELYRQFDNLNNYGQFESVQARHATSRRTTVYLQQELSVIPTTELPLLTGVPFLRIGARVADEKAGIQHAFTKRTSLDAAYDFQWISFDKDPISGSVLFGGTGHTGTATLRHRLTARTSLVGDYQIQHAIIVNDLGTFTVQTARAGAERALSSDVKAFAEFGIAIVSASQFEKGQLSPSWSMGVSRTFHRVGVDASYNRVFVPAFGEADTIESQSVSGHARTVLTRRLSADVSTSWGHDNPLTTLGATLGEAPLHSLWFTGSLGYIASPWLRVEAFYTATRQTVDRPGGDLHRNRLGIQVTTTKPMRVR